MNRVTVQSHRNRIGLTKSESAKPLKTNETQSREKRSTDKGDLCSVSRNEIEARRRRYFLRSHLFGQDNDRPQAGATKIAANIQRVQAEG